VLAALGIPAAAISIFTQYITQHPLQVVAIVLLYEILIGLLGFAAGLWRQVESSRVMQPLIDRLDSWLPGVLSDYEKYYRRQVISRYRVFDVAGLVTQGSYSLDLEEIFVARSIAPTLAQQPSPDLALIPEILPTNARSIWDYLASEGLNQPLVVIGPPGSGKTTLLQDIALTLATRKKRPGTSKIAPRLPVLLSLRNYGDMLKETPPLSLVDVIGIYLSRQGRSVPPGWVEQRLIHGRCLILLDGLDEFPHADLRRQAADWVQQQVAAYPKNRFIVTSRPYGYSSNPLSHAPVLQIQSFTEDQIEQFVSRWYLANENVRLQRGDAWARKRAEAGASDLLEGLRRAPELRMLAVNPLLLTMLVTVHRYRAALPFKRVDLYAEICEVFLGTRQMAKGLSLDMAPRHKLSVLQALAYEMMRKVQRDISRPDVLIAIAEPLKHLESQMSGESFLRMIEEGSGLLLEREIGSYGFAFFGLQEYLAALYVREHNLEHELAARMGDSWWHETIYLYADLSEEKLSVPALSRAIECMKATDQHPQQAFVCLDRLLRDRLEAALAWISMVEQPEELASIARGFHQLVIAGNRKSPIISNLHEALRLIRPLHEHYAYGNEIVVLLDLTIFCLECQSVREFASQAPWRPLEELKESDFMQEMIMFSRRLSALRDQAAKYIERTDRRERELLLLEMLRILDRAGGYASHDLYPPYQQLALRICIHWRDIIHTVQENQRGRVMLRSQLIPDTYPAREVVDVGLEVSNVGDETAEQVTLSIRSSDDYQVVQVDPPLDHLLPGGHARLSCTLRLPQVRATRVSFYFSYHQRDADAVEITESPHVLTFFNHEDRFPFVLVEKNSYVTGNPLTTDDVFFGREQLIADLADNLQGKYQDNPIVLYGQRRTGKTSLLYALKRHLPKEQYIPVFYNAEGVDSPLSLFWGLANQIYDACTEAGITLLQPTREQYASYASTQFENDFLRQVTAALGQRRLLLMIDEFESLEDAVKDNLLPKTIFSFFRKTMQHQRQLSCIFCGTHQLQELTRQYWKIFFNAALPFHITFLDDDATKALIQEPVRGHFTYDELALMRMMKLTGGHPYFTQLLCHSMVSLMNKQQRGYATRNEIDDVTQQLFQRGNDHLDYIWNESGPIERALLLSLSEELQQQRRNEVLWDPVETRLIERSPIERALIDEARSMLEKRELVSTEGFKVSFTMGLIPEWLTAHYTWSNI